MLESVKYDKNGNIYEKYSNGCEIFKEYNEAGDCIHKKYTPGYSPILEVWYDANGNLIRQKNDDGCVVSYLHNDNGNIVEH